jgi:hypothetical protein
MSKEKQQEMRVPLEVTDLRGKGEAQKPQITGIQISKAQRGYIVRIEGSIAVTGPNVPPGYTQPTAEVTVFEKRDDLEDYLIRILDEF